MKNLPPKTNAILAAMKQAITSLPPAPSREYRLHPDDWQAVRSVIGNHRHPVHPPAELESRRLLGMDIILDPTAPRLQRKAVIE